MNGTLKHNYLSIESQPELSRLPGSQRLLAAKKKYARAIEMYAATDLSIARVADVCGVTAAGLSAHIAKHHRSLLFLRYGIDGADAYATKVRPPKGQSQQTHIKYKDAIEACGDIAYIEFNISEIARMFGLNPNALSSQLRVHYPDILSSRNDLRLKLGIADNKQRGARRTSIEQYDEAMKMYRDTNLTIPEVASRCNVSESGLSQFMRFYHHDIIAEKAARRSSAPVDNSSRKGTLSGNGRLYGPKAETEALYAPALELYRTTDFTLARIIDETGVPAEGFRAYINQWHKGDKLRRKGYPNPTSKKYAPAIESLQKNPRNITDVAAEFGLDADILRNYLKKHHPALIVQQGMMRLADGRIVKRSSYDRYKSAIAEFASSPEPLSSIARRHGLVYNSLFGFVMRNCAPEREAHSRLVRADNINNE